MGIQKITTRCARILEIIIGLILSLILVLAMAEIVSRYLTGHSLVWVDELGRLLFVWLTFLAAAAAFHHRMHFRIILLWRAIGPAARSRLELTIDLITFAFALVLLTQSLRIIPRTYVQRTTALLIPMSYVYLVVPVSAMLIMVFTFLRWAEMIRTKQLPDPAGRGHSGG
jgi:TRAP-type C4-dicarboxylate transport system permease small subunit